MLHYGLQDFLPTCLVQLCRFDPGAFLLLLEDVSGKFLGLKWSLNQWFVRNTQRGQWTSQDTGNDDQNQPSMTAT